LQKRMSGSIMDFLKQATMELDQKNSSFGANPKEVIKHSDSDEEFFADVRAFKEDEMAKSNTRL
jgi:hypothetical protein